MSETQRDILLDEFLLNSEREYTITAVDSDGEELAYAHGCDYEDLAEQSLPQFAGQVVYTLSATVNGEEVVGQVSRFDLDSCLEKFEQVENAANEFTEELFEDSISVDYDSAVKERML
jgi:hypothetical protein